VCKGEDLGCASSVVVAGSGAANVPAGSPATASTTTQLPPPVPRAPDQTRDRPPPNRAWLRARPRPLGRRTHLRPAPPLQTAARPLRPPRRDTRSLSRPRLLPRLLQKAPEVIVIRVLSRRSRFSRAFLVRPQEFGCAAFASHVCRPHQPRAPTRPRHSKRSQKLALRLRRRPRTTSKNIGEPAGGSPAAPTWLVSSRR